MHTHDTNKAMFDHDRLRQQAQVQKLVRAMMNSIAASGEAETLAEDAARSLMGAMGAARRGSRREPGAARRD